MQKKFFCNSRFDISRFDAKDTEQAYEARMEKGSRADPNNTTCFLLADVRSKTYHDIDVGRTGI